MRGGGGRLQEVLGTGDDVVRVLPSGLRQLMLLYVKPFSPRRYSSIQRCRGGMSTAVSCTPHFQFPCTSCFWLGYRYALAREEAPMNPGREEKKRLIKNVRTEIDHQTLYK